ncbi:hypothetical protein HFO63_18255 [Rhizobium laguerreae]|uniref:hypothetical protein n=1 Tax=Rhizobium laguerreae TaxID=1076926 RepID=UPI001C905228|nr:hypothetical protein [Rhizobium laguerreae]MBY3083070.1 hypothetical protein [Rhizobium laguerreae]MBY3147496.1 hypothetical protein [Rhizobium laguerreae]
MFQTRRLVGMEKLLIMQGETRAHQIAQQGQLDTLADAEFSVFSQWGEDGIISWLVDAIKPSSTTFVEFGVEDFRESNTRYLLAARYWSGLVIDGSEENIASIRSDDVAYKYDLQTRAAFIDRDNIGELISSAGFDGDLGILSVDIDGVDYWVLERISLRTAIVIVEYNQVFGDLPLSVPYDSSFIRLKKHYSGMYWGASLSAFRHLLEGKGYEFVGTNRAGTNAFFIDVAYSGKLKGKLNRRHEWPCRMREVRNQDGSLAFKTYNEAKSLLAGLPVVNVATGETVTL